MELKTTIAFFSIDESQATLIEEIKIDLSDEDKTNILKAVEISKANKFIEQIRVTITSDVVFLNDEKNDITDFWKTDVIQFIVYLDTFYLYAQNKWHNGDQIESEGFPITILQ